MNKLIITFLLIFQIIHTQDIMINNQIYTINMDLLLDMTAMMESNYGRDNYKGRYAKTYMQIEPNTAEFYIGRAKTLKEYIESEIGGELIWDRDIDARHNAYIIYMSKIETHPHWKDKLIRYFNGDVEWYIYKIYYNSIKGKSTYKMWEKRKEEYYNGIIEGTIR